MGRIIEQMTTNKNSSSTGSNSGAVPIITERNKSTQYDKGISLDTTNTISGRAEKGKNMAQAIMKNNWRKFVRVFIDSL